MLQFQYQLSAIEGRCLASVMLRVVLYFNTSLVQLKGVIDYLSDYPRIFQYQLSAIEGRKTSAQPTSRTNFNTSLVQLKGADDTRPARRHRISIPA